MNRNLTPDEIDGTDGRKDRLPVWPIMLDVVGTVLLAIGIFGQIGGEELPMLEFIPVREYSIATILLGVLLMLPHLVVLLRRAITSGQGG